MEEHKPPLPQANDFSKVEYECLFKSIEYPNVLGELEDIKNICFEDIKMCYDTFYQPNNQNLT